MPDQSGNVGYRLRQARYEAQAVGGHWLAGRALRTPNSFWVQGERNGSLRNSDLGAFSTLATLGLIGLILIFLPVVAALLFTLRERGPVAFGGAMYLGAAIIGSTVMPVIGAFISRPNEQLDAAYRNPADIYLSVYMSVVNAYDAEVARWEKRFENERAIARAKTGLGAALLRLASAVDGSTDGVVMEGGE